MEKIKTHDGSYTFLNKEVGEGYHSFTGAVDESLRKFSEPTQIKKRARKGDFILLDFCFGLGYNSAMAVEVALRSNPDCHITIYALEKDPRIIELMQDVDPKIDGFDLFKQLTPDNPILKTTNFTIHLILGDARETIKSIESDSVDVVFFDPFSPKSSPEMWAKEVFLEVYRVMNKEGILATYSCARVVRDNMAAAELVCEDGPTVKRRGPGTLARKQ